MRRLRQAALAAAPFLLTAPGVAGFLLRLTVRDSVPFLATLFYATPPVLTALAAAAGAGVWAARRQWIGAAAGLSLSLLFAGYFLGSSWFDHPQGEGSGVRLVLWNISRGSRGWEPLAGRLRSVDPDLAVLVEGGRDTPEARSFLDSAFPGHDRRHLAGGFLVALKGRILDSSTERLGDGGRAAVVRFSLAGREWTAILVDLWANPFLHRRSAFEHLNALRARLRPDLVLGDFNTPRDSVFFDGWRAEMAHAFEEAGDGCDATWPLPVPFLAIDHVWFRRDRPVLGCRHVASRGSDHRAVLVTVR